MKEGKIGIAHIWDVVEVVGVEKADYMRVKYGYDDQEVVENGVY